MSVTSSSLHVTRTSLRILLPAAAALLTGGCAQTGVETAGFQLAEPAAVAGQPAATKTGAVATPDMAVKPEAAKAIKEARSLREAGKKAEALSFLEKVPDTDKDLALIGEKGMLALEIGQLAQAEKLLVKAQNPKAPDWRLQSALGSALSANGKQKEAQAQFAKALAQAPDHPAILNNLALSFALDGKHDEAERLLRQASSRATDPQAKQNLALILGLKGNVDEAKAVAETALPPDKAKANVAFFEKLKTGNQTFSKADPAVPAPVRSASVDDIRPIMQLGTNP